MKTIPHKILAVIAKPIFLASILLWASFAIHFGHLLVTGREIGASAASEIERNGIEITVNTLFIIVSLAFIKMSWQGLRYWPKRYPSIRLNLESPREQIQSNED